jgi:dihydrofolate reductase
MSVDGYVAGPNQTVAEPLGERGEELHPWMFETDQPGRENDAAVLREVTENVGAYIMGRNMFGPIRGEPVEGWRGWWGDDPPYHSPVFVLTHHPRASIPMDGGTTFHFVGDGIESALQQARAAAGDRDVDIAGGASTVNQYLKAGLLDELWVHLPPVVLGGGERLFADVGDLRLEQVTALGSPTVTHVKYRVCASPHTARGPGVPSS